MRLIELNSIIHGSILLRDGFFDRFEVLGGKKTNSKNIFFCESIDYFKKVSSRPDLSCVITIESLADKFPTFVGVLINENPRVLFFELHNILRESKNLNITKINENTNLSISAQVSKYNVTIGKNCLIEDNVTIFPYTFIGDSVTIRSGSRIGVDPFYYYQSGDVMKKVLPSGVTIIGDNVEIGYNVIIENSVFDGKTLIEDSCKINSNVFIGHDAFIMANSILLNGASIGARASIGEYSWIGINSTIANSVEIGKNSRVNISSVVVDNVSENSVVSGHYAINHMEFIANQIKSRRKS
jgi:UDP-3-O-[3-hydroxymyristoyl] glucosamine N-acyltransferase